MTGESKFCRITTKSGEQFYFMAPVSTGSLPTLLGEFEQSGRELSFENFANWLMLSKGLITLVTSEKLVDPDEEILLPF